MAAGFEDRKS